MTDRILVVAAHPDDEVLGCGGTLARHAEAGDTVDILIVAEGSTSRGDVRDVAARQGEIQALRRATDEAATIIGARPPRFLGLPDNRLDGLELLDVIKPIEAVVREIAPAIVYTHFAGDLNVDHRIVHDAVLTACRPLPGSSIRALYAFETVSSTEWSAERAFHPTRFVDIARVLDHKIAALKCYTAEMREFPHARSLKAVEALATVRGGTSGLMAAEAFEVIREIAR